MEILKLQLALFKFFRQLVVAFRERQGLKLFTGLLSISMVANPWLIDPLLNKLGYSSLPAWYAYVELTIIVVLAGVCLYLSFRYKEAKEDVISVKKTASKGLVAFDFDDHLLFAGLQRHKELSHLLNLFTSGEFYMGILHGRSGNGKTSFLRAGVYHAILQSIPTAKPVYVKLTMEQPIESIKRSLKVQHQVDVPEITEWKSLLQYLNGMSDDFIFLFDQFEQFLIRQDQTEWNRKFVRDLAEWYSIKEQYRIKLLISVRGDFVDMLTPFRKKVRYRLGPQEDVRLEAFTPLQAVSVLKIIARSEKADFDEIFFTAVCKEQLTAKDGGISPVDLQLLAQVILRSGEAEPAFDKRTFEKIGGVEGLMFRYIERVTHHMGTWSQKEDVLKVMVSLVDLEENVKFENAGVQQIVDRLQQQLPYSIVYQVLEYMARQDIRLVSKIVQDEKETYELAHERMIPSLKRLANKGITDVDKANTLLNQRVNEWLANKSSSRYHFSWRELKLLRLNYPFLRWQPLQQEKQELIKRSRKAAMLPFKVLAGCLLIVGIILVLLQTETGKMFRLNKEYSHLMQENKLNQGYSIGAIAAYSKGEWQYAKEMISKIPDLFLRHEIAVKCISYSLLMLQAGDTIKQSATLNGFMENTDNIFSYDCEKLMPLAKYAADAKDDRLRQLCNRYSKKILDSTTLFDKKIRLSMLEYLAQFALILKDSVTMKELRQVVRTLSKDTIAELNSTIEEYWHAIGRIAGTVHDYETFSLVAEKLETNKVRKFYNTRLSLIHATLLIDDSLFLSYVIDRDPLWINAIPYGNLIDVALLLKDSSLLERAYMLCKSDKSNYRYDSFDEFIRAAVILEKKGIIYDIYKGKNDYDIRQVLKMLEAGVVAAYDLKDATLFSEVWKRSEYLKLFHGYQFSDRFCQSVVYFQESDMLDPLFENIKLQELSDVNVYLNNIMIFKHDQNDTAFVAKCVNALIADGSFTIGSEVESFVNCFGGKDQMSLFTLFYSYKRFSPSAQLTFIEEMACRAAVCKNDSLLKQLEVEIKSVSGDLNPALTYLMIGYAMQKNWDKVHELYQYLTSDYYRIQAMASINICRQFSSINTLSPTLRCQLLLFVKRCGIRYQEQVFI